MDYSNKKRVILLSVLVILIVVFGVYIYKSSPQNNNTGILEPAVKNEKLASSLILYYGNGCPHCAVVEEFMKENDILSKLNIEEKEVYYNRQNAEELVSKAKVCGFPENEIGVPFLWDGEKCIVGDQPIIEFLKSRISQFDGGVKQDVQ